MLVSAIMPTTESRRELRNLAIDCFNNQEWDEKELIVIESPDSIGNKLNQACKQAKGDILIRWDDDDWSDFTRIKEQVHRLLVHQKQLTGYYTMYFWDMNKKLASEYRGVKNYCLGTSMCFTRDYWNSNKFLDCSYGEDLHFQAKARGEKTVISVPAKNMMVARIHGSNTGSSKCAFPVKPTEVLPEEFRRMNAVYIK